MDDGSGCSEAQCAHLQKVTSDPRPLPVEAPRLWRKWGLQLLALSMGAGDASQCETR